MKKGHVNETRRHHPNDYYYCYYYYQSLFSGSVFSFLTPAMDFLSAGETKNRLGDSFGLSRWLR